MRRVWALALVVILTGCGNGDRANAPQDREGSPTEVTAPAPPGTEEGRLVVSQSGCLACHRFGSDGQDGPGPELTRVGARLSRESIRSAIVDAKAPMPSYRGLAPAKLAAVVDYLAALR